MMCFCKYFATNDTVVADASIPFQYYNQHKFIIQLNS